MDPRWLLRAKRLAQNPPSARMVVLGLVVLALCLTLVAIERIVGWPEALTVEKVRPGAIRVQD